MRAAVALLLLVALTGCSDDGRTLAPAPPATTTTTTQPAAPPSIAGPMRISSVDVADGGTFPREATCEGPDRAPTFAITGAPDAAAELAVAVVDVTAGGFVHWVVAGLPPDSGQVDAARLPAGAVQGRSSSGVVGWDGPCPPPGDAAHRYEVRAYALAEPVGLTPGAEGREAVERLEEAALERAVLGASYGLDR